MPGPAANQPDPSPEAHPLMRLPADDLDLITELVLQSGSLKALAASYGVSYPTIRARLDRTIGRLRQAVEGRPTDPVREYVAGLVEAGELGASHAREILRRVEQVGRTRRDPQGGSP